MVHPMFEVEIHADFAAAHAIVMNGERETLHGHNWHVVVTVAAESLDEDGLVVDFHALQHALDAVITPFRNANLNQTPPFDQINPTAELVARHIADALAQQVGEATQIVSVAVTEAPGCVARYTSRNP